MSRPIRFLLLSLALLAFGALALPVTAAAQTSFTVTVSSAYLRDTPGLDAPRTYSVMQSQTFMVTGRTANHVWLRLNVPGATRGTWILASLGTVNGDLRAVPVAPATPAGIPTSRNTSADILLTITVKSAYGRRTPEPTGTWVQSLYQGQIFKVRARSADSLWLQIDCPNATSEVWVVATSGTLNGFLSRVPVVGVGPTPSAVPSPTFNAPLATSIAAQPFVPPTVSARAREIYQRGLKLGNNPRAFAKVGDCQTIVPYFLAPFDNARYYRLGAQYAALQATITQFSGSFGRESVATGTGFSTATVLDPLWANPKLCLPKESPLMCEYRLQRPSLVIVSLGTNDTWQTAAKYEKDLRLIIDYSIRRGVLPVLSTKADNLEGDDRINQTIRKLAAEYALPLWDFWQVAQRLPNGGLSDKYHLTWSPSYFDTPDSLQYAWPWRNLTALQTLDAVWQGVK